MRRENLLFFFDGTPTPNFGAFLRNMRIPGDSIIGIDQELQRRFFQKNATGQPLERWELKKVEISCSRNEFRRYLAALGFLLDTEPEKQSYVRLAWPGALAPRAAARLLDPIKAWDSGVRWKETIIFGGKRPLQYDKEGIIQCCRALGIDETVTAGYDITRRWDSINPQTELDMMRFLWGTANLPQELRELPTTFVDAPMKPPAKAGGPPVRPNTEDTIREWLRSNPKPGSLLLSSGAPYGMAQEVAFQTLLEPHGHTVETFGHGAPDLLLESFMREVAGCVHGILKLRCRPTA